MNSRILLFLVVLISRQLALAQTYPTYGPEIPVTINGILTDAMEPSITPDGNFIFYNSLNDGITTSLYYASRVNDSVFNLQGLLTGADQTVSPRMDAVASSDSANNFYWVSLRDFPNQYENYFYGKFNGADVTNIGRLHGDFYVFSQGWLVMDAAISYDGNLLYFCDAYFGPNYNSCNGLPCAAGIGVAQKLNDTVFAKLSNTESIMQSVNDTNYIVYAPFITRDGLELYFTRALHNGVQTEICVSVRNSVGDNFSLPSVIYASPLIPEAPTLLPDKSRMYYHRKDGNTYKLYMRYRNTNTGITGIQSKKIGIYPNPVKSEIKIENLRAHVPFEVEIYSSTGQQILKCSNQNPINTSLLSAGVYFLKLWQDNDFYVTKLVKE